MDKKDILEQNKRQNRNELDEREKGVYHISFGMGAVVVGLFCLLFSVYKALTHQTFYEFVTIITAYLSTTFLYQFFRLRKAPYLLAGIVAGLAAVGCTILFFVGM